MSAHEWPEFDQLMPNGKLLTEREFVGLTRAQYNYAKVRIDGYDALQQRCEELVAALNKHGRHESLCKIRSGAIGAQCSCVIGKAIKQVQP